jgi:hypothetical protein
MDSRSSGSTDGQPAETEAAGADPAQPGSWPDRETTVRPTRRSGKYISTNHTAEPAASISIGLVTGNERCRSFLRALLRSHAYLVPKPVPTANSNERFDVVLVLGGLAIAECASLQRALNVPVLVAPEVGATGGSGCSPLEFPCRFDALEKQIGRSVGREPPARSDLDPTLGVNLERMLGALNPRDADLFEILYERPCLPVTDGRLAVDGFRAHLEVGSRDRAMRRLGKVLRCVGMCVERHRMRVASESGKSIADHGWSVVWGVVS